jgi:hypothetical protein
VILVITYIARNTYWDDVTLPSPLRGEAVTNPFYAAEKFATELGAITEKRQTLGRLPEGSAVVVLSNWHWDLIENRRAQLERWVAAGGRLVMDQTLIGGEERFGQWAGIHREYPDYDDDESEDGESDAQEPVADIEDDEPDTTCASLHVVVNDTIPNPNDTLGVCTLDGYSYLVTERPVLWGLRDEQDTLQAVRVAVGRGSVTWINAIPFGNREFIDHGELFVKATQLHRGDGIVLISEREHPSLLSLIWTYGAPAVVLALLTVASLLWRGSVRFGPLGAPSDTARRSLAEQIRGTGRFTIRLGGGKALQAAAVRSLFEAASRRIAGYASLSHADRIAAIAKSSGVETDALANAVNHTGARRPAELARAVELIENARRKLLNDARTHRTH